MASTKATATTKQTGGGKRPKKGAEAAISPARWAGVALVIAAIVAAIILAVISPSEPAPDTDLGAVVGPVTGEATPSPAPTAQDLRVPTAKPRITNPGSIDTPEVDIQVTVEVPDDELRKRDLALVILRNGQPIKTDPDPKPGTTIVVPGVRLIEDAANELVAVLEGPGGPGPRSEPVVVTHDSELPELAITSPPKKHTTFAKTIVIEGTSEPGADIRIRNAANRHRDTQRIGDSGTFEAAVPLKVGPNRITVESTDAASLSKDKWVVVTRRDGRPFVDVDAPKSIARGPTSIKIVVTVTDDRDQPMPGAEVHYSLVAPNRTSVTEKLETNENGKSRWITDVAGSSSPAEALELVITVISPDGEDRNKRVTIPFE